jgi:hypothetical protein
MRWWQCVVSPNYCIGGSVSCLHIHALLAVSLFYTFTR